MSAREVLYGFAMHGKEHSPANSDRASERINAFEAEVRAKTLHEAADAIEPYIGTELNAGSVVMILRNMANAAHRMVESEDEDPLRNNGELPGMWDSSDLSGGWADTEGAQ